LSALQSTAGVAFLPDDPGANRGGHRGLTLLYGIGQTSSRGAFVSLLVLLAVAFSKAASNTESHGGALQSSGF
jgi:hypothetical protein